MPLTTQEVSCAPSHTQATIRNICDSKAEKALVFAYFIFLGPPPAFGFERCTKVCNAPNVPNPPVDKTL